MPGFANAFVDGAWVELRDDERYGYDAEDWFYSVLDGMSLEFVPTKAGGWKDKVEADSEEKEALVVVSFDDWKAAHARLEGEIKEIRASFDDVQNIEEFRNVVRRNQARDRRARQQLNVRRVELMMEGQREQYEQEQRALVERVRQAAEADMEEEERRNDEEPHDEIL